MPQGTFGSLDLEPLLNPKVIGIVGASQRRSRGTRVMDNLRSTDFDGTIYPINPKYDEIGGLPAYPSAADTPETIDTLVVAIPGQHVPATLSTARAAGTRAAVVLSSGFREAGPEGLRRHEELEALARDGMPICGPNCYGVLNLSTRAAAFSGALPDPLRSGRLAVISQSGGFTNLIANPLIEDRGLGFKYMISCGNQIGAKIEDYIAYLLDDDDVEVIGCFVEGLHSAARVLEQGRAAADKGKSIVMYKGGRSQAAREGVASHTGSIAGSGEVVEALLRKAGIIQARSLDELVETLALLGVCKRSWQIGRRVVVVTGSGGESSHVADAADDAGILLPPVDANSAAALTEVLPDFGNVRNPIDGTGAMFEDESVFPGCMDVAARDGNADLVAVNFGARPPRGDHAPMRKFAKDIAAMDDDLRARVVAYTATSGGELDSQLIETLTEAGVPLVLGSATAMNVIAKVAARNEARAAREADEAGVDAATDVAWPETAEDLDVENAWSLLKGYGLPVVELRRACTAAEAVAAADEIGYPVALKIATFEVSHKSDIGGVELALAGPDDVAAAYERIVKSVTPHIGEDDARGVVVQAMAGEGIELLAGVVRDAALGPAVVVASGGLLVEVLDDAAVALPPVSHGEARRLLEGLRGSAVMRGVRGGKAADVDAAAAAIVALGRLAADLPAYVQAVDLNPVIVHREGSGASCVDVWVETR